MVIDITDDDTDSEDEATDSHLKFSALASEDEEDNCKFIDIIDFYKPPTDLIRNNSLIFPITL